jgi:bacterioferritin
MAFDFERALLEDARPELGVVADYFIRLKTAAPTDPPDTTGALEGQFAVPVPQVLQHLAKMVKNEFDTIYAYTVYSQTLRGMMRDELVEHFQEHAEEELEHANFLLRRMAVLGGGANVPEVDPPHPSTDPCDIIKTMLRMEQESIADWQILIKMCGDNPMRIKAEEYLAAEQEHADDLWQLLKPIASPESMVAKTAVSRKWLREAVESAKVPAQRLKQFADRQAFRSVRLREANPSSIFEYGSPTNKADWVAGRADAALAKIKKASKEDRKAGRESAERATAARFERERHSGGERSGDLVGRIAGAVLGGATHKLHKNAPASVGAAAVGQHVGGKVGREVGRRIDAARFEKQSAVFGEHTEWPSGDPADAKINSWVGQGNFDRTTSRVPEAELAWRSQGQQTKSASAHKMAAALKRAFDEMSGGNANAAMAGGSQQGSTGGTGATTMAGGPQAEESGSEQQPVAAPMPQQAPLTDPALSSFMGAERAGTMAELQQQAAYYKQLADQSQQAAESTGQQLQAVQQQAGDLQQQVQMTQQQIDQSMQQAQQIQQQAMATAQSAQQIAAQSQQAHLQAVNESMLHKQMSEQMRASVAQMKANIQSALMQDPTQGVEMQLGGQPAGPTAGPEVQPGGPAAGAPAQELPPGAAPPDGEAPPQQMSDGASGAPAMDGAVPAGELKTSGAKIQALKHELKKRAPYMAAGGAVGAGLTALGRPHSEKTKRDVEKAEAKGGGPVGDLSVAKHKIRHALAEYVDKHPVAGSALMGAAAANVAGSVGPTVKNVAQGYLKHRKAGK